MGVVLSRGRLEPAVHLSVAFLNLLLFAALYARWPFKLAGARIRIA